MSGPNASKAAALAAYRDLSAGRTPAVSLRDLPLGDVIWAALQHGNELYDASLRPSGYEGLADSISAANARRLSREDF
jgi:hypothetical protein